MRGPHPRPRARLILAHVGKTPCPAWRVRSIAAHPRSRGENNGSDFESTYAEGSSPLTRGKPKEALRFFSAPRLIPAHAGKTPSVEPGVLLTTAHPRSRGENVRSRASWAWPIGSSPLTRGKRVMEAWKEQAVRLIPAHAGKTLRGVGRDRDSRAHPRSRGENRRRW